MSQTVRVYVPQKDGQITQTTSEGRTVWQVSDHHIEADQADVRRILSSVSGSKLPKSEPRDKPARSKPD